MANDLFVEEGQDFNLWITSGRFGTAVAICWEAEGNWFAAEDDSYSDKIGPFPNQEALLDYVEVNHCWGPWGSLGM